MAATEYERYESDHEPVLHPGVLSGTVGRIVPLKGTHRKEVISPILRISCRIFFFEKKPREKLCFGSESSRKAHSIWFVDVNGRYRYEGINRFFEVL
jgi:hypothetical protein